MNSFKNNLVYRINFCRIPWYIIVVNCGKKLYFIIELCCVQYCYYWPVLFLKPLS